MTTQDFERTLDWCVAELRRRIRGEALHDMTEVKRWERPGDPCPVCGGGKTVFSILDQKMKPCTLCGGTGAWDGKARGPGIQVFDKRSRKKEEGDEGR